jgi:hypothetical protein
VAEHLLASEVGLLPVTLVVIQFRDFKLSEGESPKQYVLSVLLKVFTVPCNDRCHVNVMLVLQSYTDCLQVMAGSFTGTFPTLSDGTYDVGNMGVEEDVYVIEESFIVINNEEDNRHKARGDS